MAGSRLSGADLEFAPFPHRHRAFPAKDVAPYLDQFIAGHIRQRGIVIAENRGVEAAVLAVGGDDLSKSSSSWAKARMPGRQRRQVWT